MQLLKHINWRCPTKARTKFRHEDGRPDTGLMHVPENGGIGFAGRRENCCAPPYQTIEFSLKAKERNSGAIIFYSGSSDETVGNLQVTCDPGCQT